MNPSTTLERTMRGIKYTEEQYRQYYFTIRKYPVGTHVVVDYHDGGSVFGRIVGYWENDLTELHLKIEAINNDVLHLNPANKTFTIAVIS